MTVEANTSVNLSLKYYFIFIIIQKSVTSSTRDILALIKIERDLIWTVMLIEIMGWYVAFGTL